MVAQFHVLSTDILAVKELCRCLLQEIEMNNNVGHSIHYFNWREDET